MSEKINAIIKRVGQPPTTEAIDSDILSIREIVGGFPGMSQISTIPNTSIMYNDVGLLKGLTPNIKWGDGYMVGNIVIAGNNHGELVSLTPQQTERAKEFLLANEAANFTEPAIKLTKPVTESWGKNRFFVFGIPKDEDEITAQPKKLDMEM